MHCALYDAGRCRSCQWLERPVPQQLADKMADLRTLLAAIPVAAWGEPVSGPEAAFRNKAKMVVSGSVERPLLGMLHRGWHSGGPHRLPALSRRVLPRFLLP
ncbi:23S rRNA (Uracil-5-) -methyltransferase rumB [Klebsiella pneumoniae]|uniref:23S rRNA (Uracil-5-) -methyltransferase rumB n=1 Tax=Klebsiella pneumoniae TaxID=573 RepID=A0A377UWQ7_KLEPN|nr:23S rRNA (Uracil-5-) -methyltransferase rumB [Klebsiella pneumoniae]